jgi:hypothetical protein
VGIENTVAGIIDQASPDKCKPVPLNLWEKKVELINIACLQQAPATQKK